MQRIKDVLGVKQLWSIAVPVLVLGVANVSSVSQAQTSIENDPPTVENIPKITLPENTTQTYQVEAEDNDGDDLFYDLEDAPGFASIDPITGELSLDPTESDGPGTYKFKVIVDDGIDQTVKTVTVTVTEVNTPVAFDLPPSINATENGEYSLNFAGFVTDPDIPQNLKFTSKNLPKGATLSPNGDFRFFTSETQGGQSFPITVTVTDGFSSATDTIIYNVIENNQNPILAPISDRVIKVGKPFTFTAKATDADVPKQTLTYSIINPPAGSTFNPATGQFSWTPPQGSAGQYNLTITVSDGNGGTDSQDVMLIASTASNPKPSGKVLFSVSPSYYNNNVVQAVFTVQNNTNVTLRNVIVTGTFQKYLLTVSYEDGNLTWNGGKFIWSDFDLSSGQIWQQGNVNNLVVPAGQSATLYLTVQGPTSFNSATQVFGPASVSFVAEGVDKPSNTKAIYSQFPSVGTGNNAP